MQSTYMNADNCNEIMRDCSPALFIVRSGVFDLKGKDGTLVERLEQAIYWLSIAPQWPCYRQYAAVY